MSHKVYEATQKIPEELWKTESYHFIPGYQGLSIEIGYHDLFEVPSDPSGVIRNVFCSVHFNSYGFPTDYRRYEEILFSLPEIQEVQRELEAIIGPV